jgi:hypothetical protein
MTAQKGRIINKGMGLPLCPPGHPMRTHSVEIDLCLKPRNRTRLPLIEAIDSPQLDAATRAAAQRALSHWKKLPLDAPEVQDWILQVLGYYRGCYNFTPKNDQGWLFANLTIDKEADPLEYVDCHAGVHHIRLYYPEYQPTRTQFRKARWAPASD